MINQRTGCIVEDEASKSSLLIPTLEGRIKKRMKFAWRTAIAPVHSPTGRSCRVAYILRWLSSWFGEGCSSSGKEKRRYAASMVDQERRFDLPLFAARGTVVEQ